MAQLTPQPTSHLFYAARSETDLWSTSHEKSFLVVSVQVLSFFWLCLNPKILTSIKMLIYESSLAFQVDSSHLRVGLRVYCTVLFLVLAFVGDRCCANRARMILMQKSPLPISMMTGWLNAISAVRMWIAQKRLPAGFFGIFMIVAEVMDIGSDLLVSGLVKPIQIPGRCSFGQGIVLTATPVNYTSIPGFWGSGYQMVSQAQSSSQKNNGLLGLYGKINRDPNFRAESQDVVGHWDCVDIQHDVIYDGYATQDQVTVDLQSKGYLYNNTTRYLTGGYDNGTWNGYFAWGCSVPEFEYQPWDMRASLAVEKQGAYDRKLIRSYHCVLNAPLYEWVVGRIVGPISLDQWVFMTYGLFDLEPDKPVTDVLSNVLEGMTMVGWQPPLDSTPIGDPTQGCIIAHSEVPWPLFTFLALATLSFLALVVYWVTSSVRLRRLQSKLSSSKKYSKHIRAETPNGLLGWMAQAGRERIHHSNQPIKARDTSRWELGPDDDELLVLSDRTPSESSSGAPMQPGGVPGENPGSEPHREPETQVSRETQTEGESA
jgi:hypothetical protein